MRYYFYARYLPSLFAFAPIVIIIHAIPPIKKFSSAFFDVKFVSTPLLALLFTFLLTQVVRYIGKFIIEKKQFANGTKFPTTQFLLENNESISPVYKAKILDKIKEDFNIDLKTIIKKDRGHSEKAIVDVIGLIRRKVNKDQLVLQHNIEYGLLRNLIAGSYIGLAISLFGIGLMSIFNGFDSLAFYLVCMCIPYGLLIKFGKSFLVNLAQQYTHYLFSAYLSYNELSRIY